MDDFRRPVLDHLAIRVADRTAMTAELVDLLDVHVIEETERFTLVGADESFGKLTLLDADADDAQPVPGRLVSVVLAEVSAATPPPYTLREGLVITYASSSTGVPRHALIGISLRASDPPLAAARFESLHGMHVEAVTPELAVLDVGERDSADGRITLSRERWSRGDAPSMLDHIGLRVDDAARWRERAEDAGLDVVRWVKAPHSRAVFVTGPEGLSVEYVEQTATLVQQ